MRITGITVCDGYADKLALGLDAWRETLDDLYVVTSGSDKETADLCRPLINETFHLLWSDPKKDGAAFNKASMLNTGIEHMYTMRDRQGSLDFVDWILLFDADVVPPQIPIALAEKGCIHGARRIGIPDPHPVTGFFMLWHGQDPVWKVNANLGSWHNASGYDTALMERWPESRRITLPLVLAHHGATAERWLGPGTGRADVEALQAKRLAEGPESWRKERLR